MAKVTPGMIEAGVNGMARARRQLIGDGGVVAQIFSAMELIQRQEEARQRLDDRAAGPAPYVHQNWPAWRYGPGGESKIFQKPEDVPEGWTESVVVHVLPRDVDAPPHPMDEIKLKRIAALARAREAKKAKKNAEQTAA